MIQSPGWLSILPPVIAIILAIWTKQVFVSLFFGIWLGWTILAQGNPITGIAAALESCVRVFQDTGNTKVIAFSAMVGALLAFTQYSGGVEGFVRWVSNKGIVKTRRKAGLLTYVIGLMIFVESSITCLVTGAISRPIFDKFNISREKLAYICDSTSAPICILIPLNGWGAYVIGLLANQNIDQPFRVLIHSLPFNLYAIFAIITVLVVILTGKDVGAMAKAEKRARVEGKVLRDGAEPVVSDEVISIAAKQGIKPNARNMLIPIAIMVMMMPIGLTITGDGNIMEGSGSTSVFWAVTAAIVGAGMLYSVQRLFKLREMVDLFFKGLGGLMPLALLMMLAFAIGDTCSELGTGPYVANLAKTWLNPRFVPVILFLVSGFIAFSTGTSWGTFGIMMPIAIPMVDSMGAHLHATVGAVLSGGIFGDHCSPISDTTIISSMASASDHIDHVRTQLPYALLATLLALIVYLIIGLQS
ncbi:sodium:solute symporter [candidate division KSB1 bacterium]|nr:sodium:solute symporter [candidate division KSB1 bacterium]NIR71242.1 sodium:solute symporter [candidate division KSB1 bacterium]NIS26183.1 sodium:solute symporter [candidate division KSB1 bacterium]NIT72961.1 sodium:solute symporter [candidate division KSB1 bacterium]NIU26830.1 sodium:solute symporter [candidate division KSB1 bacterium]